jgi:hypothetical protein
VDEVREREGDDVREITGAKLVVSLWVVWFCFSFYAMINSWLSGNPDNLMFVLASYAILYPIVLVFWRFSWKCYYDAREKDRKTVHLEDPKTGKTVCGIAAENVQTTQMILGATCKRCERMTTVES